jgi:hypothetical protein
MKITRTEAENIMNMLSSPDGENGYLALKAIDAHKYDDEDLGYLIYFFKFSKYSADEWSQEAPYAYERLQKLIDNINMPLTYSKALTVMITNNVCKDSIELFLERHVIDLKDTLDRLGYPVEQLNFNITLKK